MGGAGAEGGGGWWWCPRYYLPCLFRVPRSERATVHKNLTFSLASAEGFLMASEWAKANKVGNQQGGACELRDGWENTFSLFWVAHPRPRPMSAPGSLSREE